MEFTGLKVGVDAYVFKDGKLLVGRRKGSHGAGQYATPGGGLELGESFFACVVREVFEGTGLRVANPRFIRLLNLKAFPPKHFVDIAIAVDWVDGEPEVREPEKVESWGWYALDALPEPLFPTMVATLEALRTGRTCWDAPELEALLASVPAAPASGRLQIYFATAVRGGLDRKALLGRFAFLGAIGDVTTKHLAAADGPDLWMTDPQVYAHDQKLLAASDVVIADFSRPSTGAGFMVAQAVARGLPVLCLYPDDVPRSAMIAGCPHVTTSTYRDEDGFRDRVRAFLVRHASRFAARRFDARRLYFAGPPGSGKGTAAKALAAATGLVHVSTGDLLRALPESHPHGPLVRACMRVGDLVPAEVMRDLVVERLNAPDARMFGVILDGYPPSRADLENLRAAGIHPDAVFSFRCADAVAIRRQVGRGERDTDVPELARRRIDAFHAGGLDYGSLARDWYPDRPVIEIDAEPPASVVQTAIHAAYEGLFGSARREASFFPVAVCFPRHVRSTRVHFHVDAPDAETLQAITRRILARCKRAQGQIKMYPVEALALGPQVADLHVLYGKMPNFHSIDGADHEAFLTGRLGDGDPELVRAALLEGLGPGCMVEMEEYLLEAKLDTDGRVANACRYEPLGLDLVPFRAFDRALRSHIPPYELHLGFDLPKKPGEGLPIPPSDLVRRCETAGFRNGGWFVFKKAGSWAYRSNEFSFETESSATERLHRQACELQRLLRHRLGGLAVPVSFSLEIVHGIWTGPPLGA